MISRPDLDRALLEWFEADAQTPSIAGGLDLTLDATRRRRPKPAWLAWVGSRWVGDMHVAPWASRTALTRAALLLLLMLALLAAMGVVGAVLSRPSPGPSGRLVYALDGEIYLAQEDGADPRVIAGGTAAGGSPRACDGYGGEGLMWAPDGRHLAYRSSWGDDCPGRVIVADATGQVVASVAGSGWIVAWAPDSTRFATWDELGRTIAVYGLDGTRLALVAVPPGLMAPGDFDPSWSPDGSALVVPRGVLVPLDGSTPTQLSPDDPRAGWDVAYSADGSRIAFTGTDGSLSVSRLDGSDSRELARGPGDYSHLVWSPAGDRLAYAAHTGRSTTVWVMDVPSGKATPTVAVDDPGAVYPIRFSPDGRRILVDRSEEDGRASLVAMDVDGTGVVELVPGTGWGDWQPRPDAP